LTNSRPKHLLNLSSLDSSSRSDARPRLQCASPESKLKLCFDNAPSVSFAAPASRGERGPKRPEVCPRAHGIETGCVSGNGSCVATESKTRCFDDAFRTVRHSVLFPFPSSETSPGDSLTGKSRKSFGVTGEEN